MNTFIERTRRHTKINALLVLKRRIESYPKEAATLGLMPKDVFERIFSSSASRISVADILIHVNVSRSETFFQTIKKKYYEFQKEPDFCPKFLGSSNELQWIVDSSQYKLEKNPELVREQWMLGMELIEQLNVPQLRKIVGCVDLVAGIQYEWAAVRAFSNSKFPGFVAININAPAVILAEQMIHEAMHVGIASCLEHEDDYQGLTNMNLAAFSPFTDSVRPLCRVVHGVLSYLAVYKFWIALKDHCEKRGCKSLSRAFGQEGKYLEIINKRLDVVNHRIQVARLFLDDAMPSDLVKQFIQLFREFFPEDNGFFQVSGTRQSIIRQAGYQRQQVSLSAIARAEVALAHAGNKVSRLSISVQSVSMLGFALAIAGPVVPASWVVCPIKDERLDGFSNISSAERTVMQAEPDDDVHLYVAKTAKLARQAAKLDLQGEAGGLFKIPECCRKWFAECWNDHAANGGDLYAVMIREHQKNNNLQIARECDVSAMFRGGGLCWHFPCSPMCLSTIEVVQERYDILNRINPELLVELLEAGVQSIWLEDNGRYSTQEKIRDGRNYIAVEFV